MINIKTEKIQKIKSKPEKISEFGTQFTDYMFSMDYSDSKGWHNHSIIKNDNLSINPSACVLHYGQGIFEGLKAYRNQFDGINIFRARDNFSRLNSSAKRVCMPEVNIDEVIYGLKMLLELEKEWISSHL